MEGSHVFRLSLDFWVHDPDRPKFEFVDYSFENDIMNISNPNITKEIQGVLKSIDKATERLDHLLYDLGEMNKENFVLCDKCEERIYVGRRAYKIYQDWFCSVGCIDFLEYRFLTNDDNVLEYEEEEY